MVNDYWVVCAFEIVSCFGMENGYRIVKDFGILLRKRMMNNYWIVCVLGIVSYFGI